MDLTTLFTKDNYLKFWPTSTQSRSQQVQATARFIIYGTLIAFTMTRNMRVLVAGLVILGGLHYYALSIITPEVSGGGEPACDAFNPDDPLGNLAPRKCYRQKEAEWWSNMAFSTDRRNAERNWYTIPDNDLEPFLNFVHGGKDTPFCRQNQSACNADTNPRFAPMQSNHRVVSGFF